MCVISSPMDPDWMRKILWNPIPREEEGAEGGNGNREMAAGKGESFLPPLPCSWLLTKFTHFTYYDLTLEPQANTTSSAGFCWFKIIFFQMQSSYENTKLPRKVRSLPPPSPARASAKSWGALGREFPGASLSAFAHHQASMHAPLPLTCMPSTFLCVLPQLTCELIHFPCSPSGPEQWMQLGAPWSTSK